MKTISHRFEPVLALAVAATVGLTGCSKQALTDAGNAPSRAGQTNTPAGSRRAGLPDQAAARMAGPEKTETIDLGGGVKMEFVLIRPGSFVMGSDPRFGDGDETPRHKVTLTQPFYLGQYEVTQEQWEKVMGSNPSHFKGVKLPVDTVSWNDCQGFLAKLREKTGRKFALPTEAQWEYACRAGTTNRWFFGDSDALIGDYAWIGADCRTTHPVGGKKPNPWGLYDMAGNVWEWCADFYKHYPSGEATDPVGPSSGDGHLLRGGAWGDDANYLRCAYRNGNGPDGCNDGIGLRCVMLVDESSP